MALQFTCPYCQATQTIADPPMGRPIACAKCKKTLQIATAAPPAKASTAAPKAAPPQAPRVAPPMALPVAAAPAIRPSAHLAARSGSSAGAYLLAGVVAITMLIGVTLAIVYWPGKEKPTPPGLLLAKNDKNEPAKADPKKSGEPSTTSDGKKTDEEFKPAPKKPVAPEPEPEPEPEPPPTPLPAELDKALVEKAKKATIQLKVVQADGTSATAAGFFAVAPGVVVTNTQVLGMKDNIRPPRSVLVIVNRGQAAEKSWKAEIVALDATRDVAAVKVTGEVATLPEPLPVTNARHLASLQSVHAFGFPAEAKGSKGAAAKESSIADVRKEADGGVPEFQIKDKLDPEYAGGPLVDTRGDVIGIASASKPGAPLDLAVAGDAIQDLLEGRVVGRTLGEPYRDGGQTKVRLDLTCADPLGRIKELKVVVWTGELTAPKPDSWKPPRVRKGESDRKEVLVTYKDGKGTVEVPLPELPKEKFYWLQPVLINGTGKARWLSVEPWELIAPPLERRPALLALKIEPGERKTQLSSRGTVTVFDDKQKPHVFDMTWRAELVETVKADGDMRALNVRFARLGVDFLHNGLPQFAPASFLPAEQAAPKLEASWRLDANGALSKFSGNLDTIPTADRKVVVEFYDRIVSGFDLLALQLPNRELKPLETWNLQRPWGKNTLDVTATYEGRRVHEKRDEAYLVLRGTVKGAGAAKTSTIEGNAFVDLAKGYVIKAELKLETDVTVPFVSPTEVKAAGILEVKLTREGDK